MSRSALQAATDISLAHGDFTTNSSMATIRNPILPGFHPDPCIIRHDAWYYIATSTFEWWPAVQINRSRDLANWELAGYAITRKSQLDLRGIPDSGGVWAPALSHSDGLFWLAYSDVKSFDGPFKDVTNYLITAPAIEGPWSDPVVLNSSGFDPSLFHDEDGRKWLLNQVWKPSRGPDAFAGIVIQEYSAQEQALVGDPQLIFSGSELGTTEGPHLYRKDGYYYLITAEGGTSWTHAVTVARSRDLFGPYEISPEHPLLSSASDPESPLQKVGHGSLVQDPEGSWFLAHLCSRPVAGTRRCTLGRETALQRIEWPAGGWPQVAGGGGTPRDSVTVGQNGEVRPYFERFHDDFSGDLLSLHWNTLREPAHESWLSLRERPGFLRLHGRHSIQSLFDQSLVACRVAHHRCVIETCLDFSPQSYQQRAGLALYYNRLNFYFAAVSVSERCRSLNILQCSNGVMSFALAAPILLPRRGAVMLRAELRDASLIFSYRQKDGEAWAPIGGEFDATTLSDDYPMESGVGWFFTGLYAALCAHDSGGSGIPADFDWFRYESR